MHLRAPAILLSARQHGETAVVARLLTEEAGVVAGYVAGGRGRRLRPVVIPGNLVEVDLRARSDSQLPFARLELVESRGPWLGEPLPAAAIGWACALTATVLPERQAYPSLWSALGGLDFVSREEFDAVKDMASLAREKVEILEAKIAVLEAKLPK